MSQWVKSENLSLDPQKPIYSQISRSPNIILWSPHMYSVTFKSYVWILEHKHKEKNLLLLASQLQQKSSQRLTLKTRSDSLFDFCFFKKRDYTKTILSYFSSSTTLYICWQLQVLFLPRGIQLLTLLQHCLLWNT